MIPATVQRRQVRLTSGLAALPALLLIAACGSSGSATGGAAPDPGTVQVTLNAQDLKFDPGVIRASPGEKITLTLHNHDAFKHNFTVAEFGVTQDIDAGKSVTLVFTTKGSSDLQFFCQYHRARGMVGVLNLSGIAPPVVPGASPSEAAPGVSTSPYSAY